MLNDSERNEFILNYLNNDKTNFALLLNGGWGTGKTFYVKNSLIPFLRDNNKKCTYVSLYGVKDIESLSKNIFTESRLKFLNTKTGVVTTGIAKTVLCGLANYLNVDLSGGSKEWRKLTRNVNFKDNLLIIDDLERHDEKLSIIEILGFINNLCEQDKVKVLLVCDEKTLLSTNLCKSDSNFYKVIKEKTIGDTIQFTSNLDSSIPSIINSFNLGDYLDINSIVNKIRRLDSNNYAYFCNLRNIFKSCQKFADIIPLINKEMPKFFADANFKPFLEKIFLDIVSIYCKVSKDSSFATGGNNDKNNNVTNLTNLTFLYQYCFNQNFDIFILEEAFANFKNELELEKTHQCIKNIELYYILDDKTMAEELEKLEKLLSKNTLPSSLLIKLESYLIAIHYQLGYEISNLEKLILEHITNDELITNKNNLAFPISSCYFLTKEECDAYARFEQDLNRIIKEKETKSLKGGIVNTSLKTTIDDIRKNKDHWMTSKLGFSHYFDFDIFVEYIKSSQCTAKDIDEIRLLFLNLYNYISNISDYCFNDLNSLLELKSKINNLIDSDSKMEKSMKLQLRWFGANLDTIIKNFGVSEVN